MNVIIICGGRQFKDEATRRAIHMYIRDQVDPSTLIMSGGAPGTDTMVDREACALGRQRVIVPANWEGSPGRSGGYRRNEFMLRLAQTVAREFGGGEVRVAAFPGGVGTCGMLEIAHAAGVEYRTVGWSWTPPVGSR